jgi:hypothetical protein
MFINIDKIYSLGILFYHKFNRDIILVLKLITLKDSFKRYKFIMRIYKITLCTFYNINEEYIKVNYKRNINVVKLYKKSD